MKIKRLVWVTHSFRLDSFLTSRLEGDCTFVYFSPFYFAGEREQSILQNCSQSNLNLFYWSINRFKDQLKDLGFDLLIFKDSDPVRRINELIDRYGYDELWIDQPMFAMWHTIDLDRIEVPVVQVDSDLIDPVCERMTAKSRWMSHVKKDMQYIEWNPSIQPFNIDEFSDSYPEVDFDIDLDVVTNRFARIALRYKDTRDAHDGQTQLSVWMQIGVLDPHNLFVTAKRLFEEHGIQLEQNEGYGAAMLRQFAFREINIIKARRLNLTMEDDPRIWALQTITPESYLNLYERKNPDSELTFEKIKGANTGFKNLDLILRRSFERGVMPNRARMYFAGKIFYEAPSGELALRWIIDTFDLLLEDGQCPNNYMQCCSSMNLQYGRVMLLNENRVMDLLSY